MILKMVGRKTGELNLCAIKGLCQEIQFMELFNIVCVRILVASFHGSYKSGSDLRFQMVNE
jgi:hypothetical protein